LSHTKLAFPEVYEVTPIFAFHSAVCLIRKLKANSLGSGMTISGGVVTPAFLLGGELLASLQTVKELKFQVK